MKKLLKIALVALASLSVLTVGCAKAPEATDDSLKYITDKKELVVGLDDTFAPMGFRDEAGTLVGFDIDFANAVSEDLGVSVKFQPINWDSKEMELSGKNIDCIWNGMSITPERQEKMSLTRGYLDNKIIVLTSKGTEVKTIDDLATIQIGTQAGSSALEVAKGHADYAKFQNNLKEYATYDECIMEMQTGRIQAIIVDEVLGLYKNNALGNEFLVSEVNFGEDLYAVGLRKEDTALTTALQASIDNVIKSGKATEISNKWFGKDIVIKP